MAIEGPTGVDKTTLARRLVSVLDARLMLDPFEDHPFLPQHLADPVGGEPELRHLPTQLESQ